MSDEKNYDYYIEQKNLLERALACSTSGMKLFKDSIEGKKLTKYEESALSEITEKHEYWLMCYKKLLLDFRDYLILNNIKPDDDISHTLGLRDEDFMIGPLAFTNKKKYRFVNWLNRHWSYKKRL